jgi:hypothetical protein
MRVLVAFGFALMAATAANAATNLVVNGSLENGVAPGGQLDLVTGDITSLTGWTVQAEGVTYADNTAWDAADGVRSVELNTANDRGGISQRVFGFEAGRKYRLAFAVSANPFDTNTRPKASRLTASVTGGGAQSYVYTLNNINTATNMLYDNVFYDFTANLTYQDLSFRSQSVGEYGPVIDAVSITAVPEAATWAMLIVGFGLVGVASRRRVFGVVAA